MTMRDEVGLLVGKKAQGRAYPVLDDDPCDDPAPVRDAEFLTRLDARIPYAELSRGSVKAHRVFLPDRQGGARRDAARNPSIHRIVMSRGSWRSAPGGIPDPPPR